MIAIGKGRRKVRLGAGRIHSDSFIILRQGLPFLSSTLEEQVEAAKRVISAFGKPCVHELGQNGVSESCQCHTVYTTIFK